MRERRRPWIGLVAKRCRSCKTMFEPSVSSLQVVCSPQCAIAYAGTKPAKEHLRKAKSKEHRERKKAFRDKDRSWWMKKAQTEFNKFIRNRDGNFCISCGVETGQFHAGHYKSVGHAGAALRFHEDNVHSQCAQCNTFKSGNIAQYRINLVDKIGEKRVEWLEGPHDTVKYTIDDLKAIRAKYKALNSPTT